MKIILSRKGFDSASGGCPSPILPDGRLRSLPIPDCRSTVRYTSIYADDYYPTGDIVESLTRRKISASSRAHLDPDIDPLSKKRDSKWRGVFGQCGASQSHLEKQNVNVGDIFLFFGLYRQTVENECGLTFSKDSHNTHVLWGWMQIDKIIRIDGSIQDSLAWCYDHPHVYYPLRNNNVVYIASKGINIPGMPKCSSTGSGVFTRYTPQLCLTAAESNRPSLWRLPAWFSPMAKRTLSYHTAQERWHRCKQDRDKVLLESVGRGQEFVIDVENCSEANEWLAEILATNVSV